MSQIKPKFRFYAIFDADEHDRIRKYKDATNVSVSGVMRSMLLEKITQAGF